MDASFPVATQRRSFSTRSFGILTRVVIWYTIVTAAFRCPSSVTDLTQSTPTICKPYLQARGQIDPIVKPYYDTYAARYVDAVRPYGDKLQSKVYNPASDVVANIYTTYASPRVTQARHLAEKEWDKKVEPLIQRLRTQASAQYEEYLAPGINLVQSSAGPYIHHGNDFVQRQYKTVMIPAYQKALPYVQTAYAKSYQFATEIGIPYTKLAFDTTLSFIQRRIWPHVRILYGQNVEPQLAKIKERLSSYRDGKKLEAAIEAMDESLVTSQMTEATLTSLVSTESSAAIIESIKAGYTHLSTEAGSTWSSISTPKTTESAGTMTDELKRWQTKFAKASDNGAEDLGNRISDITTNAITHSVEGLGAALVTELEETFRSATLSLKAEITKEVSSLPEDATEEDEHAAYESILLSIRTAGSSIKEKAQALRVWKVKQNYDVDALVQSATDSTLDVIDGIRDLGLQEIGLRWASMDHATYQDWAEYHKLKKTMDDWRTTVSDVASKHEGIVEYRKAADKVEDDGMSIAQDAAQALAGLKEVAKWKIHARDESDDFEPRALPAAAARIGQRILAKISSVGEAVTGTTTSQNAAESVMSVATEQASSLASQASEAVMEPIQKATSIVDLSFTESLASAASGASTVVVDPVKAYIPRPATESAQSIASPLSSSASRVAKMASSSVESLTSTVSEATEASSSSLLSAMSSAAAGTPLVGSDEDDSLASSISSSASSLLAAGGSLPTSMSSSLSSKVESIMSAADHGNGARARSVLSMVEDARLSASSVVLGSSSTGVAESASSSAESVTSGVGSGISSLSSKAGNSASSAGTVAASMASGAAEDVVDGAKGASASMKSMIDEAGTAYETVTRTLQHAGEL